MPGQATITIDSKQWSVGVASTQAEVTSGLSGVSSIPPQTGVLFDLGYDRDYIGIDMSQMLFPLDIIFINSASGVVGVMHDVQPGENMVFQGVDGARYFLEVNAGEAEEVEVGDSVSIQGQGGEVQPMAWFIPLLAGIVVGVGGYKAMKVAIEERGG